MTSNIITQIIDFLKLPPTNNSFKILNSIQSISQKQYHHHYLPIDNQFLLIYTHNSFKTLTNPITTHFIYFQTLSQLETYLQSKY